MASDDRRRGAATAGVGAGLVVGGAHLRERGLRRAVDVRGIPRPALAERALRGGGRRAGALYTAGAVSGAVGATGLVYGSRKAVKKRDGLLEAGIKGQGEALKSRKGQARDRKAFAQNVAISTLAGTGAATAYGRRYGGVGRANLVGVGTGAVTSATVTRVKARRKPKSPSAGARTFDSRNGASKTAFRMGTVPSDDRFRKQLVFAKAQAAGADLTLRDRRGLARKKRISAGLSAIGGTAGLTGVGLLLARKKGAATTAGIIGGGFGGTNALLNTPIQRKEAQSLAPKKPVGKRVRRPVGGKLVSAKSVSPDIPRTRGVPIDSRTKAEMMDAYYPFKKSMPGAIRVPRPLPSGLRQRKTYTASSVRGGTGGRLIRTKAGVR